MILNVEKKGNEINIFGRDDCNILLKEIYYYHNKREAIKLFKEKYNLKYQRNIIIKMR